MTERSLSEERKEQLRESIASVRRRMAEAMALRGEGEEVLLLAATKTVPAEEINFAVRECGITDIGENRVQELLDKYDALDRDRMKVHFIGQLQTNKVKYIIDKVDLIHSVDSEKLAKEIDRRAGEHGKKMDVLVEVNIGREENKGGVMPEDVGKLLAYIDALPHVSAVGIMTIAPASEKIEDYEKFFAETSQIYLDNFAEKRHNINRRILSMGMSDSLAPAIKAGSNLVRIGSALFGARAPMQKKPVESAQTK